MKRVYLEICNACNLNCSFCTLAKGNNYLSVNEIEDCLKQIKPYCNYVYLHILGEPLLHPDFEEILALCDRYEMSVQLVTNGTLLYKYPDLLRHRCIRKLSISLHSINNVIVDDPYFKTIDRIIENKEKYIELRFFEKESLDNKLNLYLNKLKKNFGLSRSDRNNSYKLKDNIYVRFDRFFKWPDINDDIISENGTCHGAVDMIAINSKLDVTICCLDPYAYNLLGNLKNQSLETILRSDKYLNYVEDMKKHHLSSELCKRCSYRLRFK